MINFVMGRFKNSGGDFDLSDVSGVENGRMMSDILNDNGTTSRFSFKILIYLEKIKRELKRVLKNE